MSCLRACRCHAPPHPRCHAPPHPRCNAPPHPRCFRYDVEASPAASVMSSASTALGGRSSNGAQSISSRQVHSLSSVLSLPLLHLLICFCQSSGSTLVRQQQRRWTPEEAQRYASEREIESDRTWCVCSRQPLIMFPTPLESSGTTKTRAARVTLAKKWIRSA